MIKVLDWDVIFNLTAEILHRHNFTLHKHPTIILIIDGIVYKSLIVNYFYCKIINLENNSPCLYLCEKILNVLAMRKILPYAILFLLVSCSNDNEDRLIGGCKPPLPPNWLTSEQSGKLPVVLTDAEKRLAASECDFSVNFFRTFMNDMEHANPVVSTFSIFSQMGILANAAEDRERDNILSALCVESGEENLELLNSYCSSFIKGTKGQDVQAVFDYSSSVWSVGYQFDWVYKKKMRDFYATEFQLSSHRGNEGREKVNKWIYYNCLYKFSYPDYKLLKYKLGGDQFFMNCSSFHALWGEGVNFDTFEIDDFQRYGCSESERNYLISTGSVANYYEYGPMEAIGLNYGSGNYELVAIKSSSQDIDIKELIAGMDATGMKSLFSSARKVTASLKIMYIGGSFIGDIGKYLDNLGIDCLSGAGLTKAFSDGRPLKITDYLHVSRIEMNEVGCNATGNMMDKYGTEFPDEKVSMEFNRPFIYLVRETSTGTIILMGAVTSFS